MDSKTAAASTSADYQPKFEWVQDQENHILQVELRPEFTKEDLKVQIDTMGSLKVSGEHKVDGQKPIAFRKTLRLPENFTRNGIRAGFQDGVLKVVIPFKEPPKKQALALQEKTLAAAGPTTAPNQSENDSPAAENGKPTSVSGGDRAQKPSDKSETHRDMRTADVNRKEFLDESRAGGNAAPPDGAGGENGRPADKSVNPGVMGTEYERWSTSKYINRIGVALTPRRKQIASVGMGILVVAVVLGFYAAYRLGESVEDGNY